MDRPHARGPGRNAARGWFGIFHHDRLVGCAGVADSNPVKQTAEIGYYLAADACGKGLATRACRALVDHLFIDLHLHRVGLQVAATNGASIRLAERLGFVLEGRLREADFFDDERRDLLVYGILRQEWPRPAPPAIMR